MRAGSKLSKALLAMSAEDRELAVLVALQKSVDDLRRELARQRRRDRELHDDDEDD